MTRYDIDLRRTRWGWASRVTAYSTTNSSAIMTARQSSPIWRPARRWAESAALRASKRIQARDRSAMT